MKEDEEEEVGDEYREYGKEEEEERIGTKVTRNQMATMTRGREGVTNKE